ncbi:hypothetical protein Taro_023038 [Colocasia esculenta]|uniref:Uncharacterized protein n=1 Tax=Colocasia esculenta TaxID=4460 RepID=A0A843V5B2_COLES|nr:hypothetical protein [Colocasia esculenta]
MTTRRNRLSEPVEMTPVSRNSESDVRNATPDRVRFAVSCNDISSITRLAYGAVTQSQPITEVGGLGHHGPRAPPHVINVGAQKSPISTPLTDYSHALQWKNCAKLSAWVSESLI